MQPSRPIDTFVKRSQNILQKEYVVIGKTRISGFTAWAMIAFFIGIAIAVAFLASRSGTLEGSQAARTPRPVWSSWSKAQEGNCEGKTSDTQQCRSANVKNTVIEGGKRKTITVGGFQIRNCIRNCGNALALGDQQQQQQQQQKQQQQQQQVTGSHLCSLPEFHRKKVIDEVEQAHERVMNTCNDSGKFNAAEERFKRHLNDTITLLNNNILIQTQLVFMNTGQDLKEMRMWMVQTSVDMVAAYEWRTMAADIRNTCPSGMPGSNAQDSMKVQQAFDCSKSLAVRYVQSLQSYIDLYNQSGGKLSFQIGTVSSEPGAAEAAKWLDATSSNADDFLASHGINNFTDYLNALNNLSLASLNDGTFFSKYVAIPEAQAALASASKLLGLETANPGPVIPSPAAAREVVKAVKWVVRTLSELLAPSGVLVNKEEIAEAYKDYLGYDMKVLGLPAFLDLVQILTGKVANAEKFFDWYTACQRVMPFLLAKESKIPEESFTRNCNQLLQVALICYQRDPSKSISACLDFACKEGDRLVKVAVPGYDGPPFQCAQQEECKAIPPGQVGDACHPKLSVEQQPY